MKVAFAGLGVMGAPMAGHIAVAGHDVTVFNRSPGKAERWVAVHGGAAAHSITEAAKDCEVLAMCVGVDDDVRQLVGEASTVMAPGAIILDHTTTSARLAREMESLCASRGLYFLDAPVSGGEAGARNGALAVMVGGDVEALARAMPVLSTYGRSVQPMGPAGNGQLTKMVNQICIAGVVQGLAEAVAFARRAGLDLEKTQAAIGQGAAQSWQMDNRWATMAERRFDFGFAVDLMRKDLGLVLDEARSNGARLEITALIDQFYAEIQEMGGRRWDTSSLVARLDRSDA